ncbi:MAG: dTDP-4-dehydrorhamnose 3,5-epimerase family protein [Promethearchaeota archaeon]
MAHDKEIVQINNSVTKLKGSVRGMHFQYPPKAEIKIIKCIKGKVFDVAVDIRKNSTTFLEWHGEVLTEDNFIMLYIPQGFAHGFQTLEDNTELLYLHTEFYSPEFEGGLLYNDPILNITWPLDVADISQRDMKHPLLTDEFKGVEV